MAEARPEDIYIALMGMTGAGKSSFIALCSEKKPNIGHDLESCTTTVDLYSVLYPGPPRKNIFLVDTPGFDDTNKSDSEVLRELGTWLAASYTNKVQLSGIIYLHRINDTRMRGSAKRNIRVLKQLCGEGNLQNVVLATTMWDIVDEKIGANREANLKQEDAYWGHMHAKGSAMFRHANTRESALNIIKHFVDKDSKVTLQIQEEMIKNKIGIAHTAAAQQIEEEISKERARYDKKVAELEGELREALQEKERETAEALRDLQDERDEYLKEIESLKEQQESILNMQKFYEEKFSVMEAKMLAQMRSMALSSPVEEQPPQHPLSALKWDHSACGQRIKILDDYVVKYDWPDDTAPLDGKGWMVRAKPQLDTGDGFNYFEVCVLNSGIYDVVCVGVSTRDCPVNTQVGWGINAIGYHGDDGILYAEGNWSRQGPRFSTSDIIGCGVMPTKKTPTEKIAYFTLNGQLVGEALLSNCEVYPTVGLKGQNTIIRANFGQEPFVFKYDGAPFLGPWHPTPFTNVFQPGQFPRSQPPPPAQYYPPQNYDLGYYTRQQLYGTPPSGRPSSIVRWFSGKKH